ncbi:hypothetical protein CHS0354_011882 [Potamilus streckersoni]|uniref:Uncharacterized protein n=1 Tax=Potamilus streckersoni TaxID=2493646 RepID=A0AAE0T685_9BIVA|nr:hypothetical protein CHS0354_011882 [Potamilus streckersoni]
MATKSTIKQRGAMTVVQRSSPGVRLSLGGDRIVASSTRTLRASVGGPGYNLSSGTVHNMSKESVKTVRSEREKERAEMQGLNERFASYIEKVSYLEGQNKALLDEVERLKKLKGFNDQKIREMYEDELKSAREELERCGKDRGELESQILALTDARDTEKLKVADLEKSIEDYVSKMEKLNNEIAGLVGDIELLRRNQTLVEDENNRLKLQLQKLQDDNARLREDLTEATNAQLEEANRAQTLEEELEFTKNALMTENEELRRLLKQDSAMPDVRAMWEGKMKQAIAAIRQAYDDELRNIQANCEAQYELQLRNIQSSMKKEQPDSSIVKEETRKLKSQVNSAQSELGALQGQIASLRELLASKERELDSLEEEYKIHKLDCAGRIRELEDELADVTSDLNQLSSDKLTLEMEIGTYRKLLEQQEHSLESIVESRTGAMSKGGSKLTDILQSSMSQSSSTGQITVQRTSRGKVAFQEYSPEGKFVSIENTSPSQAFDLKAWKVLRKDGSGMVDNSFTFGDNVNLGAKQTLTIYGKKFSNLAKGIDQVLEDQAWASGSGTFVLVDDKGAEKATLKINFM